MNHFSRLRRVFSNLLAPSWSPSITAVRPSNDADTQCFGAASGDSQPLAYPQLATPFRQASAAGQYQAAFLPKSFFSITDLLRGLMLAGSLVGLAVTPGLAQDNSQIAGGITFENAPNGDGRVTIKDTVYTATGTVRYLSPTGTDASTGGTTQATAWKTLSYAVSQAPTGATLVLASGSYSADDVDIRKALTLQPAPHAQAWITGSVPIPTANWTPDGATWRANWTPKFRNYILNCPSCIPRYDSNDKSCTSCTPTPEATIAGLLDMVFVNDIGLKQVLTKADVRAATATAPATFYVDTVASRLYIGVSPAGKQITAAAYREGVEILAPNVVVRGLGFRGYAGTALLAWNRDYIIENCTFAWNGLEGARIGNTPTNVKVRGNTFSYNGHQGLSVGGPDAPALGFVIYRNVFSYNNNEKFARYWAAAGLKLHHLDDVVVRNNLFDSNNSMGLWFDLDVERVKVLNNVSRFNSGVGLFFEVSRGALFAGNVSYSNSEGIYVSGSSDVRIYNNTLVGNKYNLRIKDTERLNDEKNTTLRAQQNARGVDYETREVFAYNNVLADGKELNLMVLNESTCKPNTPMVSGLNHNLYLRSTDQTPAVTGLILWNQTACTDARHRTYTKLVNPTGSAENFRTHTTFEMNGALVDGLSRQALFANSTVYDYTLKPCTWTLPAAMQNVPADVRTALGVSSTATLRVGALQTTAVCQAPQTVAFTAETVTALDQAKAGQTVTLTTTSTGDAALAVTYSLVTPAPAVATLSGNTLTLVGVGTVTVRATKASSPTFAAATVEKVVNVGQGTQTINYPTPYFLNQVTTSANVPLTATSSAGLPVSYTVTGPATLVNGPNGPELDILGYATNDRVVVTATQGGNANYLAALPVERAFRVSKAQQTLTFASLPPRLTTDANFSLGATSSAGLTVAYTVTGPATLVSADVLDITGEGTVVVTAVQAGNETYASAANVSQSFTVTKAAQVITFNALADRDLGTAPFALTASATGDPNLLVTYALVNTAATVATLSGSTLTLRGAGTVTVRASKAGNATYLEATPVERSFVVRSVVALALNAGGPAVAGSNGISYAAEGTFVTGGQTLDRPTRTITNTPDPTLYQTERYGEFSYALPVPNGTYELTLKFAELYFGVDVAGAAGQRQFDVLLEGETTPSLDNLDIFALAGGANKAYDRTLTRTITDGVFNVQFRAEVGKNNPQLSALVLKRVANPASRGLAPAASTTAPATTVPLVTTTATVASAPVVAQSAVSSGLTASFSAFPNPAPVTTPATLELAAATAQTVHVYIRGAQGELVSILAVPLRVGQTQFRLPSAFSTGTYYLQATIDKVVRRFTLKVE